MRFDHRRGIAIVVVAGGISFPALGASIGQGAENEPSLDLVPPFGFEQADPFAMPILQADSMEAAQSLRGATYEPAPAGIQPQKARNLGAQPVGAPSAAFRPAGAVSGKPVPPAPPATSSRPKQR